ncbi:hypothetical protein [Microbacterium aurugineum]|uniref:hypothetical protein n=1 Tax=Microbacterium aurugineum TaxID=2851642 RepID=UPI0020C021EF|nr:hypothetical protein [Microbacterium aurugineum]MCK8475863.1 hypothetical protein [Microbacterium aurugineum]
MDRGNDVVLLVKQPQSSPFEAAVLDAAVETRPDIVVVYAGWPAQDAPAARRAVLAHGASRATAVHIARALTGRA